MAIDVNTDTKGEQLEKESKEYPVDCAPHLGECFIKVLNLTSKGGSKCQPFHALVFIQGNEVYD